MLKKLMYTIWLSNILSLRKTCLVANNLKSSKTENGNTMIDHMQAINAIASHTS